MSAIAVSQEIAPATRTDHLPSMWQTVWRKGFVPGLSTPGLEALRAALQSDDARLRQHHTVLPPAIQSMRKEPVQSACAVGLCGWLGDGLGTVGEIDEFFARKCFETDVRLQEPAVCRHFLNWFDDAPRDEMRSALLAEVEAVLKERGVVHANG